jgi:hypothetical protein
VAVDRRLVASADHDDQVRALGGGDARHAAGRGGDGGREDIVSLLKW